MNKNGVNKHKILISEEMIFFEKILWFYRKVDYEISSKETKKVKNWKST